MRSAEEIIDKLKKSFNAPRPKDERIKVVVFCILISTTFWFFSALNKSDYITQINYPIQFEYDTEAFVAVDPLPEEVRLEVTGGGWDLMTRSFGLNMEPIVIRLDEPAQSNFRLSSTLRGELSPKLEPVTVNYMLNDSIFFHIEPRITRSIQLAFDSAGIRLAPDYRLTSSISVTPPYIRFTGPESLVNSLPEPYLVPAGDSMVEDLVDDQYDVPEVESDLVTADISEVNVRFEVDEFVPYQRPVKVARLNFPDSTLQLAQESIDVMYTIKRSEEVRADSLDIMLLADFYTFDPSDSTVGVSVAVRAAHIRDLKLSRARLKVVSND